MENSSVEENLQRAFDETIFHYQDTRVWKIYSLKESLAIYTKPSNTNKPISICQVLIHSSPEAVISFLQDLNNWDEWFLYNKPSKLMTKTENFSIWYFSTKSFFTILGRELLLASQTRTLGSKIVFFLTSVDFASSESRFFNIKAKCFFYSFIAEPEGSNCNLTVLFHDDPKGLAYFIHSKLSKSFMKRMLVLKNILEKPK